MVKGELLPFSPLLPSNIQGDSTVMPLLNHSAFNTGRSLCVRVCPKNYIVALSICCNTGFPDFQQPSMPKVRVGAWVWVLGLGFFFSFFSLCVCVSSIYPTAAF